MSFALFVTIFPVFSNLNLLPPARAAGDGLNAYYRFDDTGLNDQDVVSPAITGYCAKGLMTSTFNDWGNSGTNPIDGCSSYYDYFSGYFTGYILGPKTGVVNFSGTVDDNLTVRIGSTSVVNRLSGAGSISGSFNFTAGAIYPIQIYFHEATGAANMDLKWDAFGAASPITTDNLGTTPSKLITSQYQTLSCKVGFSAECPAYSPQEIYNLYGTATDGNYWLLINGAPAYQYVLMSRSLDSGGWILAMKGNKTTTRFSWSDTYYWENASIENANLVENGGSPARIASDGTGTDAKYEAFNGVYAEKIRAIFPEKSAATFGGRYTTVNGNANNYGFMWEESFSSLTAGAANTSTHPVASYPLGVSSGCTGISTKILVDIFKNSKRCKFRTPNTSHSSSRDNSTSYDPIGANLFSPQPQFAWFGINYLQPANYGTPSAYHHVRFGLAFNENGSNGTDEGSNDVTGGIGLRNEASGNRATGNYNGCCTTSGNTASTGQYAFEMYVRKSDPSVGASTNLSATSIGSGAVKLTWGAPAGVTPFEYVVQYKSNSQSWDSASTLRVLAPSSSPSARISGLSLGQSYDYRVFARTLDLTTNLYNTDTSASAVSLSATYSSSTDDSALDFNNANQSLENTSAQVIPAMTGATDSVTVEAWINPRGFRSPSIIMRQGTSLSSGLQVELSFNGNYGILSFKRDGQWDLTCNSSVPKNAWMHIAAVFDNARGIKCYIDGALMGDTIGTGIHTSTTALPTGFYIGNSGARSNGFDGLIDEVKIWNGERSASNIATDMQSYTDTSTSTLLAYYDFNEGTGTSIYNRKPNSITSTDLTFVNTPVFTNVATTTTDGPYTVVTFKKSIISSYGGWKAPATNTKILALIVGGGGGGGGGYQAGGGGAGGYIETTTSLTVGSYYPIQVGNGGRGFSNPYISANGVSSSAFGFTAVGGGSGASEYIIGISNTQNIAGAGGSGGGGSWGDPATNSGGTGTSGQGNSGGRGYQNSSAYFYGGGGGGATSAGAEGSSTKGGNGGAGKLSSVLGSTLAGGGGGSLRTANTSSNSGLGGSGGGGNSAYTDNANVGDTGGAQNGIANTGGGGGAGLSVAGTSYAAGGAGGSGIVAFKYITASVPVYGGLPAIDTTTAGIRYKFQMTGSATSPLIRNFIWQSSTDTGTTWTTLQSSTSDSYTTTTLETTTSGIRYKYRVIVTDSDTAGLSITDSATAYLVINRRNTITSSTSSFSYSQKYGESQTVTFTFAYGTGTRTSTVASSTNNTSGKISWTNLGGDSATVKLNTGLWAGTHYETLTVTDSVTAFTTQMLTISVSKADTITVTVTASPSTSVYTGSSLSGNLTSAITGLVNSETGTVTSQVLGVSDVDYTSECQYGGTCKVGDLAPGGGYVFYVSDRVINKVDEISSGGIYLATAPATWRNANGSDGVMAWGCATNVDGTSGLIGTGALNTQKIITAQTSCSGNTVAAKVAADLQIGAYSDWFMPSDEELFALYSNVKVLAGLSGNLYWSSRQAINNGSNNQYWARILSVASNNFGVDCSTNIGSFCEFHKNVTSSSYVSMRPIRAFSPLNMTTSQSPIKTGAYISNYSFSLSSPASADNYLAIEYSQAALTITQAKQAPLKVGQYDAYPDKSTYPINVYGGSGTGAITRIGPLGDPYTNTAGCSYISGLTLTATNVGSCTIRVIKEADRNYFEESTTATIYWIQWKDSYATQVPSGAHTIPLSGGTQIIIHTETVTAGAFSDTATPISNTITSARVGDTIRINSTGYSGLRTDQVSVTFRPMEDAVVNSVTSTYVEVVVPSGAITGVIALDSPRGVAYTSSFTISP
jgi:hypothetical protein